MASVPPGQLSVNQLRSKDAATALLVTKAVRKNEKHNECHLSGEFGDGVFNLRSRSPHNRVGIIFFRPNLIFAVLGIEISI